MSASLRVGAWLLLITVLAVIASLWMHSGDAVRAFSFLAPFAIQRWLQPRLPDTLAALPLALSWAIREHLEHISELVHGTDWSIANVVDFLPLLQSAAWGGRHTISVIVVLSGCTTGIIFSEGMSTVLSFLFHIPAPVGVPRKWWRTAAVSLGVLLAAVTAGQLRLLLEAAPLVSQPSMRVAGVTVPVPTENAELLARMLIGNGEDDPHFGGGGSDSVTLAEWWQEVLASAELAATAASARSAASERFESAAAAVRKAEEQNPEEIPPKTLEALRLASEALTVAETAADKAAEGERAARAGDLARAAALRLELGADPGSSWRRAAAGKDFVTARELEVMTPLIAEVEHLLLEVTSREADAGARLVLWPELGLLTAGGDAEQAMIDRLQKAVRAIDAYVVAGVGALHSTLEPNINGGGTSRPRPVVVNKVYLVDRFGRPPVLQARKAHPQPGTEADNTRGAQSSTVTVGGVDLKGGHDLSTTPTATTMDSYSSAGGGKQRRQRDDDDVEGDSDDDDGNGSSAVVGEDAAGGRAASAAGLKHEPSSEHGDSDRGSSAKKRHKTTLGIAVTELATVTVAHDADMSHPFTACTATGTDIVAVLGFDHPARGDPAAAAAAVRLRAVECGYAVVGWD